MSIHEAIIVEDSDDDDSFDSFELMDSANVIDPSKLIDSELVNLLRYCHELLAHKETEDYQDEMLLKSQSLGTKTKERLIIFDMDETLIAAKFEGHTPAGFEPIFNFPFKGAEI